MAATLLSRSTKTGLAIAILTMAVSCARIPANVEPGDDASHGKKLATDDGHGPMVSDTDHAAAAATAPEVADQPVVEPPSDNEVIGAFEFEMDIRCEQARVERRRELEWTLICDVVDSEHTGRHIVVTYRVDERVFSNPITLNKSEHPF